MDEFSARRGALRKQFLEIAQLNSRSRRHLGRIEIRIDEAVLDDATDAHEQLVRVTRWRRITRRKEGADKVMDREPHVAFSTRRRDFFFPGIADQIEEKAADNRSVAPLEPTPRFESEMRYQSLARQNKRHGIPGLASVAGKKRSRPAHIHEYDIADTE